MTVLQRLQNRVTLATPIVFAVLWRTYSGRFRTSTRLAPSSRPVETRAGAGGLAVCMILLNQQYQ